MSSLIFWVLRNLTIIDWALKMVNARREQNNKEPLDITQIDLEDRASFTLLKASQTTAVFQLESRGMKDLIKRLQPDVFEDIIALVALYRPGPLGSGMVDDFVNRKHGRQEVAYPHPDLEPIVKTHLWRYFVSGTGDANCASVGQLYAGWRGYVASCNG